MTMLANQTADRPAYSAPNLTVYGAVADLTASGLTGSCETGNVGRDGNCVGRPSNKPGKRA